MASGTDSAEAKSNEERNRPFDELFRIVRPSQKEPKKEEPPKLLICDLCGKVCKSEGGRTNHKKSCKKKDVPALATTTNVTSENQILMTAETEERQEPLIWGNHTSPDVSQIINAAYEECIKWRRNIFMLPTGKPGREFIDEIARLITEWTTETSLHGIALKAVMIMPSLLLQKPKRDSKAKEHNEALRRRLLLWKEGEFDLLIREARFIQSNLPKQRRVNKNFKNTSKRFNDLMLSGKVKQALRILSEVESSGILPMSGDNFQLLLHKHPKGETLQDDLLLQGPVKDIGSYAYEAIDGNLIKKTAREIEGAAGPSMLDADGWKRILTSSSFGTNADNLCHAIAAMTKKICSSPIEKDDHSLESFLSCRLIPLDKNPGLRPIGIGEVLRRIIGRSVMKTFKQQIMQAAGATQMCAGQKSGCEALVHAFHDIFEQDECEAVILVDADNAFNRLNRQMMLHNVKIVCPEVATYATNCYQNYARLFISGGHEISSEEGTTQGDPASMPIYALGLVPLLDSIDVPETQHGAYADDIGAIGKLKALLKWWIKLMNLAPNIGYYPNPEKSWLIVKPEKLQLAKAMFAGTRINITDQGKKHLGASIGSAAYKKSYLKTKTNEWVSQLTVLSEIAKIYPHAAYCAFTAGFKHKLNYVMRTLESIEEDLKPVEEVIRNRLIPSLLDGRTVNEDERELLSLPVKLGGLGITNFTKISGFEYSTSKSITTSLRRKLTSSTEVANENTNITTKQYFKELAEQLRSKMSPHELKANDIGRTEASIWLSALPLRNEGFNLSKREFVDAICIRYGWSPTRLPTECVCGESFNVDHALCCKVGGLITLRHNEIRDVTADLLSSVCKDVRKEPVFEESNDNNLRADVSVRGFWQRMQRAFVDVRVFYPFAPSYRSRSLQASFRMMENEKKNKYNREALRQNATFTPLIFSSNGGMSRETVRFYQRLAELLSEKHGTAFSCTSSWVKRKVMFGLIRTAVVCLRGSRGFKRTNIGDLCELDNRNYLSEIR